MSALTNYDIGRTTFYAARADQRMSYCCYVPRDYKRDGTDRYRLLVAIHGTLRDAALTRDDFAALADKHRLIVLAPLFPCGITAPREQGSYKLVRSGDVQYDTILLSMVEELTELYRIDGDRFALFGFSGGGHFAHRFFYAHPERLSAVSIAASGSVTLLDDRHDFWVGTRNFESVFGKKIDIAAMRQVPVHMVIGGDDTDTAEITIKPDNPIWMEGAGLAGANRQDRLRSLKASMEAQGINVRFDVVPGVGHRRKPMMPAIEDFFGEVYGAKA